MAVYRPTYRDQKTGKRKRAKIWWIDFTFAGRRINESTKSTRKTIAVEAEKHRRLELERALNNIPTEARTNRIKTVNEVVDSYSQTYSIGHRAKSVVWSKDRLAHVKRHIGGLLMPDVNEDRIRRYMAVRLEEGAGNRTVNMELAELSRAMGKKWSVVWPRVSKLEENTDVGRALSPAEESALLAASTTNRSALIGTLIRVALLTGMRAGEMTGLTWGQVDLEKRMLVVGRAKTDAGSGRRIPINDQLFAVLATHAAWFTSQFGQADSKHYVFPWGSPFPSDPHRPTSELKTAWTSVREEAKVSCRWHDLRHTFATKLAEAGTPESTMLALMGHMSRRMLEHYSHIREQAKRTAMAAVSLNLPEPVSIKEPKESPKVASPEVLQ